MKRPLPASFEVSSFIISSTEFDVDEQVTISLTVTNTGETEGSYNLEIKANGEVLHSQTVILAGGASRVITIDRSFSNAGDVQLEVADQIASLMVLSNQPEPIPEPTETPTPSPSLTTPVSTGTPTLTHTVIPAEEPTKSGGSTWMIFGGSGLAVLVIAAVVVVRVRRKRPGQADMDLMTLSKNSNTTA